MRRSPIAEARPRSESVSVDVSDTRQGRVWGLVPIVVSGFSGGCDESEGGHAIEGGASGRAVDLNASDGCEVVQRPRYLRSNPPPLDPARVGMIGVIPLPSGRTVVCAIGRDGVSLGIHCRASDAQAALDASRFVDVPERENALPPSDLTQIVAPSESDHQPSGDGPKGAP